MPLLCKRLNVADPYRGKPPPASEAATFQPWTLAELGQSRCVLHATAMISCEVVGVSSRMLIQGGSGRYWHYGAASVQNHNPTPRRL